METFELNLVELNSKEIQQTEGGFLDILLAGIAVYGAVYAAGYACGQAYYHYTH